MAKSSSRCRAVGAIVLALSACAGERSEAELVPASRTFTAPRATVTTYGDLSQLMQQGRTGPAVWLRKLSDDPSLIGIGSLSGLRGEVAVVDGRVWLGYATGTTTSHGRALDGADETAAFLAVASVPEWRTYTLATGERFDGLERRLEKLCRDDGLDTRSPIPVVISGRLQNLRFHVADGRGLPPGTPITERDLLISASKGAVEDTNGVLVGFFSTGPQPAILHPKSRLHLHVVLRDKPEVAHLDHVDLDRGVNVRLPMPER